MSTPSEPEDVKLISSLFSSDKPLIERVIDRLKEMFGPADWISPWLLFDRTRYYEKEMGWPLHRRLVSFRNLIRPEAIVDVKLQTNRLEGEYSIDGRRMINLDPGYITLERMVLATGKNYTHRIYLAKGIYADLTLAFHRGAFSALEWTYRDYADPVFIGYLNDLREMYKRQVRGLEHGPEIADRNKPKNGG